MSDQTEGRAADAGQTAQKGLDQANEISEQLSQTIRDKPLTAALVALGIGYLLGKIF